MQIHYYFTEHNSALCHRGKASSWPENEQLSWSHKLVLPCFREFERGRHHVQLWVRVVSRQDLHGGIWMSEGAGWSGCTFVTLKISKGMLLWFWGSTSFWGKCTYQPFGCLCSTCTLNLATFWSLKGNEIMTYNSCWIKLNNVLSPSVMSDSLQPHGL